MKMLKRRKRQEICRKRYILHVSISHQQMKRERPTLSILFHLGEIGVSDSDKQERPPPRYYQFSVPLIDPIRSVSITLLDDPIQDFI